METDQEWIEAHVIRQHPFIRDEHSDYQYVVAKRFISAGFPLDMTLRMLDKGYTAPSQIPRNVLSKKLIAKWQKKKDRGANFEARSDVTWI